jgi:RHS repeat-associated protein
VNRRLTYDAGGYVLTDTRAYQMPGQQGVTFTRDPTSHLVQRATDALGRVATLAYDANGNPTAITRMFGTSEAATTSFTYDPFNVVRTVTDPLGHTTTTYHDNLGRAILTTDPLGHQTTYNYNASFGQLSAVNDPLGHSTQFSYNLGDLVAVRDPVGNTVQRTYDALGRLATATDALGQTTRFTYDQLDHVLTRTDPVGGVTTFTYDEDGNLLTSTDPRGHTTTFTYGNTDRLTKRTDALNRYDQFTYDTHGNVTLFRDGGAVNTAVTYDNLNRPTFVGYNQDTSVSPPAYESTVTYTYDGVGRLTEVADSAFGTITRTYDDFDRLASEQSCFITGEPCRTVSYTYDAAGRRTSMSPPSEAAVTYTYDVANHLTQIAQGSGSPVAFTYDAASRRTRVDLPNGTSMTYGYDAASRLTNLAFSHGTAGLGDLTYTYDAAGHRTTTGGSWARTGVPTAVTTTSYDNADELTNWSGTSIPHDAQGDLKGDGPDTYFWNARRQLTEVANSTGTVQFFYDPFGRRWKKNDHGTVRQYAYDGLQPVQELAGTGASTTLAATLLTGLRPDEIFQRSEGLQSRYFLTEALGSTVALTDDSGAVATEYTYDPFGGTTVTNHAGTATNPYQYAGRENDGTGLYYYRARYYHPGFGRFISADPLGHVSELAASGNLYVYGNDAPTTFIDPLGLLWVYGFGGSNVKLFGPEASTGKFFGAEGDFITVGAGTGMNQSEDVFLGWLHGDTPADIAGTTWDWNFLLPYGLSVTIITDPTTGDFLGATVGWGPSLQTVGASATVDQTCVSSPDYIGCGNSRGS